MRRRDFLFLGPAGMAVWAGCLSPTLPLPPPARPTIGEGSEAGKVRLVGFRGARPNALVVVYNANPNVPRDRRVGGAEADAEGTWQTEVIASSGDVLEITQQVGDDLSTPLSLRVP